MLKDQLNPFRRNMTINRSIVSLSFLLVVGISCETTGTNQPEQGYISVQVTDERDAAIADVDIFIVPDSSSIKTDANGMAFFTLETGDYFIDASICCIGPGFFNYHEPVTVERDDTVKLELEGCTACN